MPREVIISEVISRVNGETVLCTHMLCSGSISKELAEKLKAMLYNLAFNYGQVARDHIKLEKFIDGRIALTIPCKFSERDRLQLERLITADPYNFKIVAPGTSSPPLLLSASSSAASLHTATGTSPRTSSLRGTPHTGSRKSVSFASDLGKQAVSPPQPTDKPGRKSPSWD